MIKMINEFDEFGQLRAREKRGFSDIKKAANILGITVDELLRDAADFVDKDVKNVTPFDVEHLIKSVRGYESAISVFTYESIKRSNRRRSKRVNEKLRPDVDNKRYYDAIEEFKALPFSYEAITKLCNKDIGEVEDIIEMLENSSNANDFNYFQDKYKFAYEAYHKLSSIEDQLLELHREYVDIKHDIMGSI